MKLRSILAASGLLVLLTSCQEGTNSEQFVANIKTLKGLTRKEIREKIGPPDSTYVKNRVGKIYDTDLYWLHNTEFRYRGDTIREIVLLHPYSYEFKPEIITDFGFNYRTPDTNDSTAIYSWKNLDGIKTASIFIVRWKKPDSVKTAFNVFFDMSTK
jgi:hypothetical protein